MWIKYLNISGKECHFSKGKNFVSDEVFQAVKGILLREKYNGTVTATVIMNGTNYTVGLKGGTITVCLYDGTNVTSEYQQLLDLSPEQKQFLDFDYKKASDYSKRFMFYKDINYYYPKKELRKDTFGISETRCFRNYLNGYV